MTREEARENRAIVHVDSDGNITYLSETGGKLNVNSTVQNPTADPETGLATSAKQLADNHNVTVSNPTADPETGLATSAKQLADNHNVTVSNPTADPETGLATSANQTSGSQMTMINDGISINRKAGVSPTRQLKVADPVRLVGTNFDNDAADINFWQPTLAGGGTIVQGGEVNLKTNGAANGSAKNVTQRKARYIVGTPQEFKTVCEFYTAGAEHNVRRIGVYDDDNGVFFQLDNTTFSIGSRTGGGADTLVSSGSFNGTVSEYVMDTGVHKMLIEISGKAASFIIDGVLIHKLSFTHLNRPETLTLPITMENTNSLDLATAIEFHVFGASIQRMGALLTAPASYFLASNTFAGNLKIGAGAVQGLTINNCENTAVITLSDSLTTTTPTLWAFTSGNKFLQPVYLNFSGMPFFTGLRLTVTAADASVTVIYE